MPRVKRKIDPDAIYEAWTSGAVDGLPGVIVAGSRYRGSDPQVQVAPWMFVTSGTPAHEWPSELGTTKDAEPAPQPEVDIRLRTAPVPIGTVVELAKDIRVLAGATGERAGGGGHPGQVVHYKAGTRFDPHAEIVTRLPDNFFKVV